MRVGEKTAAPDEATTDTQEPGQMESTSLARSVLKVIISNRLTLIALAAIVVLCVVAIFAQYIAPYNPNLQSLPNELKGPSMKHLLGTDELGRDILSRIIYGSRVSLEVGSAVVLVSVIIGISLGTLAGYYGGKIDTIIMRFVDVFLSFPGIILAVGAVAIVGPGLDNVILALSIISWPGYTRVMRGEVLKAKNSAFVLASRSMGAPDFWIMRKHVIPATLSPLIVLATIGFGWAVLAEAGLSFLGLGVQPPTPSWGGIVAEGLSYILEAPYIAFIGGLTIALTVLCFNLVGDGLRDSLDPSLRV